jgi:hypothetical protein
MIMDAILNFCLARAPSVHVEAGGIICHGGVHDPDAVRHYAPAYCDKDLLLQDRNFKYRTWITFIPYAHEPKWRANFNGTNTVTETTIGSRIVLIQKLEVQSKEKQVET